MPGRTYTAAGQGSYRYGFNGKENDSDVKGEGNQQDYGMRIYDPRLGRFLSVDPLTQNYPELTPYQFASNTPVQAIDLDGLEMQRVIDGSLHIGPYNIQTINQEIWRKRMDVQSMAMQKKPAVDPKTNIAQKIINTKKVEFATSHVSEVVENAYAKNNVEDAAKGEKMSTSNYGHAAGKKVSLNENSANAFLSLADKYTMSVSEIAGAKHGDGSLHYQGKAFDVNVINGERATAKNKYLKDFVKDAKALGFTVIAAPAEGHDTHVHLQWGSN
jgi:RHS repeat-associated protein